MITTVYILIMVIIGGLLMLNLFLNNKSIINWLFVIGFYIIFFVNNSIQFFIKKIVFSDYYILKEIGVFILLLAFFLMVLEDRRKNKRYNANVK